MRVPRGRLPQNPAVWHSFLRDYFCDKDAVATESAGDVHLHLSWPDEAERHIDPDLEVGLRWWGRGVSLGSMWSARWREGRIMTSLYDTWTLLSWCEWLARVPSCTIEQVVILHVDDHRDLGSPRLHLVNGALVDAITKEEVQLTDPLTVQRAIESGALAPARYAHYCKLRDERDAAAVSLAQRRSEEREIHKALHKRLKDKYGRH